MVLGRPCTGVCAADGNVGGCRGFPAPAWLTGFVVPGLWVNVSD